MDFTASAEQVAFRQELRAWLAEHAPAGAGEPGDGAADPASRFERLRDWHRTMAAAGYVGVHWPVEYGGRGLGPVEMLILQEELTRARTPALAGHIGVFNVAPAIIMSGTEEQKDRYLERIRNADDIWCQGMSEPGAGSDLAALSTRADAVEDGFVVNGQKIWSSNAHHADLCQLYVRTSSDGPKQHGVTCLLVDTASPGFEVRPIRMMNGESHFCELFLTDLFVPADRVLGEVDGGWRVARSTLGNERIAKVATHVRMSESVELIRRLGTAPRPDGAAPFADAALRQRFVDVYSRTEILRWLGFRIQTSMEQTGSVGPEASGFKLAWSELAQDTSLVGIDVLGAMGMLAADGQLGEGAAIGRDLLVNRGLTIATGTSEIQRNIMGEALGLPREPRATA